MKAGFVSAGDGTRIYWEETGDPTAPSLILSNSLGTTISMWDQQVEAFSNDFRLIRFDTCGHGKSSPRNEDYEIATLGRDVLAIMDELALASASFAGVSLGGMIGQWLAVNAPERIDKLVLANTSAYMPTPDAWNMRRETVLDRGMGAIADAIIERWFSKGCDHHSDIVQAISCELLDCDTAGYAGACAAIRDMDQRAQIKAITCPTLIVGGTRDIATPAEHSQFLHSQIAGSQLAWLGTGHLSNVEDPDGFLRSVRTILWS